MHAAVSHFLQGQHVVSLPLDGDAKDLRLKLEGYFSVQTFLLINNITLKSGCSWGGEGG